MIEGRKVVRPTAASFEESHHPHKLERTANDPGVVAF